jgi:hypothetical protein
MMRLAASRGTTVDLARAEITTSVVADLLAASERGSCGRLLLAVCCESAAFVDDVDLSDIAFAAGTTFAHAWFAGSARFVKASFPK